MMADVVIFGKAGWPYTDKAREVFGAKAEYHDVKQNAAKLDEMLKFSKGQRKVPVIVEGDKVTVGFGGSWGVWASRQLSGLSAEWRVRSSE